MRSTWPSTAVGQSKRVAAGQVEAWGLADDVVGPRKRPHRSSHASSCCTRRLRHPLLHPRRRHCHLPPAPVPKPSPSRSGERHEDQPPQHRSGEQRHGKEPEETPLQDRACPSYRFHSPRSASATLTTSLAPTAVTHPISHPERSVNAPADRSGGVARSFARGQVSRPTQGRQRLRQKS